MKLPSTALLCAALLLPLSGVAQAGHGKAHRHVNVTGEGEVLTAPDRARLSMAVEARADQVKDAEAEVNRVVRAFLKEARALGIKDEHLSTAGVSVQPEYVWDEKTRSNRLTGYRARRDIEVVVTNLDQIGDVLLRATQAGVNRVSPPQLESSRAEELRREALVKATTAARERAELLAKTLGVKLGAIRRLDASEGYAPPPVPMPKHRLAVMAEASGNEDMGFAAGQIRFSATVQAEFDLIAAGD